MATKLPKTARTVINSRAMSAIRLAVRIDQPVWLTPGAEVG